MQKITTLVMEELEEYSKAQNNWDLGPSINVAMFVHTYWWMSGIWVITIGINVLYKYIAPLKVKIKTATRNQ